MEFIDKSGQSRSNGELREALREVEKIMVTQFTKIPPNLAVYLSVIKEALIELLKRRQASND